MSVDAPTTFDEVVQRDEVAVFAYVYIAGVGHVFSNVAQPAGWTLDTDYTWSQTFIFFRAGKSPRSSIKAVSAEADPTSGSISSGTMRLEFGVNQESGAGTWPDLLLPSSTDTWFFDMSKAIRPSTTRFKLHHVTGIAADDILHVGKEAVKVVSVDTTNRLVHVTRGYFGSQPTWHGSVGHVDQNQGLVEITEWPDKWRGRIAEVWLAACHIEPDGSLTPLDTAPKGAFSKQIFRGPIRDFSWSKDLSSIGFRCQTLSQTMEASTMSWGREYLPGPQSGSQGWCFIEQGGVNKVEFDGGESWVSLNTAAAGSVSRYMDVKLTTAAAGTLYDRRGVEAQIRAALIAHYAIDASNFWFFHFSEQVSTADGTKIVLEISEYRAGAWQSIDTSGQGPILKISSATDPDNQAARALGATSDVVISDASDNTAGIGHYAIFQDPVPFYYISPQTSQIYWHRLHRASDDAGEQDPPAFQGTLNRTGEVDYVGMRFGDQEIMRASFRLADGRLREDSTTAGTEQLHCVVIDRVATAGAITNVSDTRNGRGKAGTVPTAIAIPPGEAQKEEYRLKLGVLFDNHDLLPALLTLACSNGDTYPASVYNTLPVGWGAGLDPAWFDAPAWERLQNRRDPVADNWWIEDGQSVRQMIGMVAKAYGLAVVPKLTTDGYKISITSPLVPPVGIAPDVVIDADWTESIGQPPKAERNETDVVNVVRVDYMWDWLTGQSLSDDTYRNVESIANYGESKALRVAAPWLGGEGEAEIQLADVSTYVFIQLGRPPTRFIVPTVRPQVWALNVNDVVGFTHPKLPNYRTKTLGLTAEPMVVEALRLEFGPGARNTGVVTLRWRNSTHRRVVPYAPCLRLLSLSSGSTYNVRANVADGGFSALDDSDIDHYAVAATDTWYVRAYLPGQDDYQDRTVTGVDTTNKTITLSSALTGDLASTLEDVVIAFNSYDTAGPIPDSQKSFAAIATEDTNVVTDSDAVTERAAEWA